MRALLIPLMLLSVGAELSLQLDGERWGEFQTMRTDSDAPALLVLENGRVRGDFFELWWQDAAVGTTQPGQHQRDPAACRGRAVTVVQSVGEGLRARERTWTLMDACPVAWDVSAVANDGATLTLDSLSFTGRAIAVAR